MENVKKRAYTKRRLIKELAFRSGISQNQARAALEAIIEIAYREARANYFILPGLCKFDVVRRQARNVRNPVTGEALVLPERDALHVVLSKRAKETESVSGTVKADGASDRGADSGCAASGSADGRCVASGSVHGGCSADRGTDSRCAASGSPGRRSPPRERRF